MWLFNLSWCVKSIPNPCLTPRIVFASCSLDLTLRGLGLGATPSQTSISVCGSRCVVTASNGSATTCTTPPIVTESAIMAFPFAFPHANLARANGVTFSTDWSVLSNVQHLESDVRKELALAKDMFTSAEDVLIRLPYGDQNANTIGRAGSPRQKCTFTFSLAEHKIGLLSSVALFPPTTDYDRPYAYSLVFQARNLTTGQWEKVADMSRTLDTGASMRNGWTVISLKTAIRAREFRVVPHGQACRSDKTHTLSHFKRKNVA